MRGRVVWCLFGVGGLGVFGIYGFLGVRPEFLGLGAGMTRTERWHVIPLFVIPLFELK